MGNTHYRFGVGDSGGSDNPSKLLVCNYWRNDCSLLRRISIANAYKSILVYCVVFVTPVLH